MKSLTYSDFMDLSLGTVQTFWKHTREAREKAAAEIKNNTPKKKGRRR